MPLKLCASYSKKVPAEVEYSSKSYLASVEVELPSNLSSEELNAEIHKTYAQLEQAVDEQISGQTTPNQAQHQQRPQGQQVGNQPYIPASNKQIKYIVDLGNAKSMGLADLNAEASRLYGVESIYNLAKADASRFVDVLKAAA
jgi:hypothetical protein